MVTVAIHNDGAQIFVTFFLIVWHDAATVQLTVCRYRLGLGRY